MSLLLPTALFALLALALPLLIHLQRRGETPPPRLFAALAYIDPQARPKQRVRLRDRLLLLLRLLLLAVLAFVLAQPLLHGRAGPPWVLLWPELDPAQVDALNEDAELRWLAPGFPRVDALPSVEANQPFSLLRQLAFERPLEQELEVRVPRELDGWDGVPLQLGRAVEWTVLPVDLPALPAAPRAQRVAVQVMDGVEPEQHRALTALRAYFEALGEGSPLRLVEAGEAPPEEGVDALWVLASAPVIEPLAGQTPQEQPAPAANQEDAARGDGDEMRARLDSSKPSGDAVAQGSDARGESEATVGQGPPYADMLSSLSPAWQMWMRDGGRVLISGRGDGAAVDSRSNFDSDGHGTAPTRFPAHEADAAGKSSREAQGDPITDGAAAADEEAASADRPRALAAAQGDEDASTVATRSSQASSAADEAAVLAALDTRARTLWRGEQARLSALDRDGAELRLFDCPLDARCLPELLEPDFPRLLQGWLAPEPAPAARIDANLIAPSAEGLPPQPAGTPLRDALVLALLVLMLAERWLAATRRPA